MVYNKCQQSIPPTAAHCPLQKLMNSLKPVLAVIGSVVHWCLGFTRSGITAAESHQNSTGIWVEDFEGGTNSSGWIGN